MLYKKFNEFANRIEVGFIEAIAQIHVKGLKEVFAESNRPVKPADKRKMKAAIEAIVRANAAEVQAGVLAE